VKYSNTGMFNYYFDRRRREISDGTSTTMLAGEIIDAHVPDSQNPWSAAARFFILRSTGNPLNSPTREPPPPASYATSGNAIIENAAFASDHSGGAQFVYVDGHVAFVSDFVSTTVYVAQSTINLGDQAN
jgi:prepilin-type processing-associated H-X9-DG protein